MVAAPPIRSRQHWLQTQQSDSLWVNGHVGVDACVSLHGQVCVVLFVCLFDSALLSGQYGWVMANQN